VALLDALSGRGDQLWERYSRLVLPGPLELPLPSCLPPALLPELQHAAIQEGAAAQQARLRQLLPELDAPACEGARGVGGPPCGVGGARLAACWGAALQGRALHEADWSYLPDSPRPAPLHAGGSTWLQWGFGCVRSRAFQLRPDCFASVPLLDVANHAPDPSCGYRLSEGGGHVELVAMRQLAPGEEATISYTGPQG
jgi:hypothetical protein